MKLDANEWAALAAAFLGAMLGATLAVIFMLFRSF